MKIAEETTGIIAEIKAGIEENIAARLHLLKLQTAARGARLAAAFLLVLLAAGMLFFVLLFVSLMAGYLLAGYTGSLYTGFGIVAALYLTGLVVLWAMRKKLARLIADRVVATLYHEEE
jgi:uncharacterized membrane protein YdjX (TVP38/TMEM64 family)